MEASFHQKFYKSLQKIEIHINQPSCSPLQIQIQIQIHEGAGIYNEYKYTWVWWYRYLIQIQIHESVTMEQMHLCTSDDDGDRYSDYKINEDDDDDAEVVNDDGEFHDSRALPLTT